MQSFALVFTSGLRCNCSYCMLRTRAGHKKKTARYMQEYVIACLKCADVIASMDAIPYVDSLIKEYLLFRGFTGSLRAFNRDIASDRGQGFQADQLCDMVFGKLLPLNQASELMEVLEFLSNRVYSRLPGSYENVIRKLEVNTLSRVFAASARSALSNAECARCLFGEPT